MAFQWEPRDIHRNRRIIGRRQGGDYVIASSTGSRLPRFYLVDLADGTVLGQPLSAQEMAARLTEDGFHPQRIRERRKADRRQAERRRQA